MLDTWIKETFWTIHFKANTCTRSRRKFPLCMHSNPFAEMWKLQFVIQKDAAYQQYVITISSQFYTQKTRSTKMSHLISRLAQIANQRKITSSPSWNKLIKLHIHSNFTFINITPNTNAYVWCMISNLLITDDSIENRF